MSFITSGIRLEVDYANIACDVCHTQAIDFNSKPFLILRLEEKDEANPYTPRYRVQSPNSNDDNPILAAQKAGWAMFKVNPTENPVLGALRITEAGMMHLCPLCQSVVKTVGEILAQTKPETE